MMPQFDTFSFFSQLFWVFIAFTYLYLSLCLYLLPAFAAVLKIRAKKLSQTELSATSNELINKSATNLLFLETLTTKIGGIYFYRKNLNIDINNAYSYLIFKNEIYYPFNFLMLNQFKVITFFI